MKIIAYPIKYLFFIIIGSLTMCSANLMTTEQPVEEVAQPNLISTP